LQTTIKTILPHYLLPLPMEPLSPRGAAQTISSCLLMKGRHPSCPVKRRQSRGPFGCWLTHPLMNWSLWNKMKSKIMFLWNIAPLAKQQEVPGVKGEEAPPLAEELLSPSAVILSHPHRSAVVDLCHPRRAEAIIHHGAALRPCSTVHHGVVPSSSGGSIGGTTSSAGGTQGGPPPSSMGGGNIATSSSVSSCNKAPGAPSTEKGHLD
jgi:hypothetical protein